MRSFSWNSSKDISHARIILYLPRPQVVTGFSPCFLHIFIYVPLSKLAELSLCVTRCIIFFFFFFIFHLRVICIVCKMQHLIIISKINNTSNCDKLKFLYVTRAIIAAPRTSELLGFGFNECCLAIFQLLGNPFGASSEICTSIFRRKRHK